MQMAVLRSRQLMIFIRRHNQRDTSFLIQIDVPLVPHVKPAILQSVTAVWIPGVVGLGRLQLLHLFFESTDFQFHQLVLVLRLLDVSSQLTHQFTHVLHVFFQI